MPHIDVLCIIRTGMEQTIVDLFHLQGVLHGYGRAALALLFCGGEHRGIHLLEFVLLAGGGILQGFRRALTPSIARRWAWAWMVSAAATARNSLATWVNPSFAARSP